MFVPRFTRPQVKCGIPESGKLQTVGQKRYECEGAFVLPSSNTDGKSNPTLSRRRNLSGYELYDSGRILYFACGAKACFRFGFMI